MNEPLPPEPPGTASAPVLSLEPPPPPEPAPERDLSRSPAPGWRPWTGPLALVGGVVLATIAGLVVDLPALALGANVSASNTPPGLAIADTFVQDVSFVLAAVYCAHLGGRAVRSWQFGLRPPAAGWRSATGMFLLLIVAFILVSAVWSALSKPPEEELLKTLGSNEGTALLLASAALTCVIAPICEEFLFRGYIFTALRNWRGVWPAALITGVIFGAVHAGSAPELDLLPLAALGFGLCLLYRYSGSLYPCFLAHSLNNSIAFAGLENWGWQAFVLIFASFAAIGLLVRAFKRIGLIAPLPAPVGPGA